MKNFEIRKATLEDLDKIVELGEKLHQFHVEMNEFYNIYHKFENHREFYEKELKDEKSLYLVALVDGKIVGYASASYFDLKKEAAPIVGKIRAEFVEEKFRGLGIGKKMVYTLIDWLKTKNVSYIETGIDVKNQKNIKNFEKAGFEIYSVNMLKKIR